MSQKIDNIIESAAFTEFLFNNISSAVFILDKDMKIKKINRTYEEIFNKKEIEVVEVLCGNALGCSYAIEQNVLCGETTECENCALRNCVNNGSAHLNEIQTIYITRNFYIDKTSIKKYFRMKLKDMIYDNEAVSIVTIDDITELEEQKEQIREMANLDYLTKVYNRRYFFEIAEKLYKNAKNGLINIAAVMIDLDHFKKVNDYYGHDGGDFILTSFADILKTNLLNPELICRYGGEEFCFLVLYKNPEEVFDITEKIRVMIENKQFIYDNQSISITLSAGININLSDSLNNMLKKADEKLYEAKESGRNRILVNY